jgi:cephalosporin hydroxylase
MDVPPLPPTVEVPLYGSFRHYWLDRVRQHNHDSYAGVPLSKFPEDLRAYEHLLWLARPEVVIELGTDQGGSALWFRDRLRTLAAYDRIRAGRVISVDVDLATARKRLGAADPGYQAEITLLEADVTDPELPARVAEHVPEGAACFVVEDTAHNYETTTAALRGFARFVPLDGFFVVEDGFVDVPAMRPYDGWPIGVLPALHDWLASEEGSAFTVRRDLELYGVSCHPEGFLQRFAPTASPGG